MGLAVLVVVVAAAAVAAVLLLRRSRGQARPIASSRVAGVATTLPYRARPGPGATTLLTEPVDPLTLSVPGGWKAPPSDPLTLSGELERFTREAPSLASLLRAESQVAGKSAVRLFAYQPVAPHAFVSVISFSSPGADPLTPSTVDALVAEAKKRTSNVAVSGARLPVGQVLQLDSSFVAAKQHVVVEDLILIAGGRTILVEMVTETSVPGRPPLFDQLGGSLRLS